MIHINIHKQQYSKEEGQIVRNYRQGTAATRAAAIPLKTWLAKAGVGALFAMAALLIVLDRKESTSVERLRLAIIDGVSPLVDVISSPARMIAHADRWTDDIASLYVDNRQLREDNAHLLQWQKTARQLQAENEALRRLLKLKETLPLSYVTARVTGGSGGIYTQRLMLDSGERDGVLASQAIISEDGLVGRVMTVGGGSATVLAITDINSRLPVIGESSRRKAVLAGDNSARPRLDYVADPAKFEAGERIVTADDGNIFPGGLVVGEVASDDNGSLRVIPYADFSRLEYVQVVSKSQQ